MDYRRECEETWTYSILHWNGNEFKVKFLQGNEKKNILRLTRSTTATYRVSLMLIYLRPDSRYFKFKFKKKNLCLHLTDRMQSKLNTEFNKVEAAEFKNGRDDSQDFVARFSEFTNVKCWRKRKLAVYWIQCNPFYMNNVVRWDSWNSKYSALR